MASINKGHGAVKAAVAPLLFREDPDRAIVGTWESDGRADHYVCQSPQDVIERRYFCASLCRLSGVVGSMQYLLTTSSNSASL